MLTRILWSLSMAWQRWGICYWFVFTVLSSVLQNWRLPGWRVCWVLGPKNLITALSQSGAYIVLKAGRMVKLIDYQQDRSWTGAPIIREAFRNHHRNRACLLMLFYSLQLAAIPLLEPERVQQEKVRHFLIIFLQMLTCMQIALQKHFKMKRDHVLKRLEQLHLKVDIPPTSTFYIWLNLERLPPPLNNGLVCVTFPFIERLC